MALDWGEYSGIAFEANELPRPHPILFVHGWWAWAWLWDLYLPFFAARGYNCYALNLRGNHGSKPVANLGHVTFADHLADVRAFVDKLGNPIIIAHSAGGLLALKLAEERDFPAIVAITPAPPRGVFALTSWPLVQAAARFSPALLQGKPFLPDKHTMCALDLNRLPPAEQDSVYQRMVPAPGKQGFETALRGIPIDAKRIRTPLLIVAGADDGLTPPHVVQATARKVGALYREYPGHAHYLLCEPGWERIAQDIAQWLDETVVSRPQPHGDTQR